jgi:hypothetical protein
MKITGVLVASALAMLTIGCAGTASFHTASDDVAGVPARGMVEFAVDDDGNVTEVEYHIAKDTLPAAVLQTADELFPGSIVTDAEKEWHGTTLYYEVTKKKGAEEWEVMMTPEGMPHRYEIEVNPNDVPAVVLAAADNAVAGGRRTKVEKILDGDKNLIQYHIKKDVKGIKYKILISPDGGLSGLYREVPAEIEVPVRQP